jgi:hypothetical protein
MKNRKNTLIYSLLIGSLCNYMVAQTSLGSANSFMNELKKNVQKSNKGSEKSILLKVSDKIAFEAKINFEESNSNHEYLVGEIKNKAKSTFFIDATSTSLKGYIIFMATKEAYKYSSDKSGNALVSKVDINTLICTNFPDDDSTNNNNILNKPVKIDPALLTLESLPGAPGCVLLDFDGYDLPAGTRWNNGKPMMALSSGLNDENIKENWEIVAEDFRPFNLNITTNEAVFNTYPKNKRMRAIITRLSTTVLGGGGEAVIGSFSEEEDLCWVRNVSSGKLSGETSSHEIGHTLDLQHDGRINPMDTYYEGIENTPFAPIMGSSYFKPVAQWSKGEYNAANNTQDDLTVMSGLKFGLGYRKDEYGNTIAEASPIKTDANGIVQQKDGIITNEMDIDFFSFTTSATGNVSLNAKTVARHGNLDIIFNLYDASGKEIGSFTDTNPGALNAAFTKSLPAGKYFVSVDGTGAGDPKSGGYSAYASVGSYSITGKIDKAVLSTNNFDAALLGFNVFPMPFGDELKFTLNPDVVITDLKLYDNIGKVINIPLEKSGNNLNKLDTSVLSQGIYYLKIATNYGYKTVKIAKQ